MNPSIIAGFVKAFADDLAATFKNDRKNTNGNFSISSLSAESKKSTAQFPVIFSKAMSATTMQLIAKALERKYAVQLKLVMESYFMTNAGNLQDYLSQFHNNLDSGNTVHQGKLPLSATNPLGLDESVLNMSLFDSIEFNPIGYDKAVIESATASRLLNKMHNTPNRPVTGAKATAIFTDADVKKCNEMIPTIVPVTISFINGMDKGNSHVLEKAFNVAVKTSVHPVSSEEMVLNIKKASERSNGIFSFIKATTGEISILKDFILMSNQTKADHVDKSSGIWNKLRERRMQSSIRNIFRYTKGLIPNTTLVLSIAEVDFLKNEHNVDVMSTRVALGIIKEYFLAGLLIVDEGSEILYSIDDSSSSFDQMTFGALSREMDKSSDLKTVVNLMKTRGGY